jgi:quinoprotein glucose dehydrogenase
LRSAFLIAATAFLFVGKAAAGNPATDVEWPHFGGNAYFQRYSPLDQIAASNLGELAVAWTRPSVDPAIRRALPDLQPSTYNRGTPIMVDGTLYVSNAIGLVEAFDPATGALKWVQHPLPATIKEAAGESTRGVEYWRSGDDRRIISIRGQFLHATHADDGSPVRAFGDEGKVFIRWPTTDNVSYHGTSGPLVVGDTIVIGGFGGAVREGGYGDTGAFREAAPENIRGYDVRTGHLLWTFHVMPLEDDDARQSWGNDSWKFVGNMGAWAPLSADPELGYVYAPLTAPTLSYYGGHRPGDNKYSSSLVALDARTGRLVWAQQLVHHDLWDYDAASPPVLGDVKVGGRLVKAVMQTNKPGMLFVFDRKTGEAVWPIEERPVPQSTVPGEHTSPTQPFSTRFPGVDTQGVSPADLVDFTPAIHQEAVELVSHYVTGPLFTPPSLVDSAPEGKKGTLVAPGVWGAANWNSGAFDPDSGAYFAVSRNLADVYGLFKPTDGESTSEYAILHRPAPGAPAQQPRASLPLALRLSSGLPVLKPPYGRITAYDIGAGKRLWMAPNGDDPAIRANPALKNVKLPPLLGNAGRGAPLITKTLIFLADASDAIVGQSGVHGPATLRAYDKRTGRVVWETSIPVGATGAPMTYSFHGRQYVVLPVGGAGNDVGWIAYALGSR